MTKLHDVISFVAFINASIIQRSVISHPSYVVAASDLHATHADNHILKYADDTFLLAGFFNIASLAAEFEHVKACATVHPSTTFDSPARRLAIWSSTVISRHSPIGPSHPSGYC